MASPTAIAEAIMSDSHSFVVSCELDYSKVLFARRGHHVSIENDPVNGGTGLNMSFAPRE
jgi:hypothetical protein